MAKRRAARRRRENRGGDPDEGKDALEENFRRELDLPR